MPELPDITIYVECLAARIVGHELAGVRLVSPFVLRTAEPRIQEVYGTTVRDVYSLGKQIIIGLVSCDIAV